jgi:flagellar hook-associated protein 1 FlgK
VSSFNGLNIALSALYAQRRALDVTGQNVANVNTEGYTRQRVHMKSDSGPLTAAIHSRWNGTGQGVRSDDIQRLRDEFLELRGHQEHATDSSLRKAATNLQTVELAFAEPADTAIASQLADFWAGWDDVANRPDDVAARAQLVQRATTLASSFGQLDSTLAALSDSSLGQTDATIAEVNAMADGVAELNSRIQSAVNGGFSPTDLMDQRDILINRLSEKVGVTIRPGEAGATDVFVDGAALVRGTRAEHLQVEVAGATASITWVKDGANAKVSGEVGGMLKTVNDIVPRYRAGLTAVSTRLANDVNALHVTGYDKTGTAGVAFFQMLPTGLVVNPAVVADPGKVAASSVPGGGRDGSLAGKLADLTGADTDYRDLVVRLGVEAQTANRRVEIQSAITSQIDAARESEAGVNLDEEMTNMLAYQHGYDAAARMLTAVDQALDTLINRTGLVGR